MLGTQTARRSLRASAPRFVKPLNLREEDGVKILECHVDGYPRPDIRWEKGGQPVGKSRRVHMIRSGDMCLLQIRVPQADDFGHYSCIASNIVGTAITHIKLGTTAQASMKNFSRSTAQNLSPFRNVELRSRSMDRSRESVNDVKNQCSNSSRSRSVSRSSRQDVSSNTKSKLPHLTNNILKRSDAQSCNRRDTVSPKKSELSKSIEDSRKNRKGFLHKVKIPDIFVGQKHDSVLINGSAKQSESGSVIKARNIEKSSNVIKFNGNTLAGTSKSRTMKSESLKDDSFKNGALRNGSPKNDSLRNRSPKNEPLRNGSPKCGSIKSSLLRNESLKHELLKHKLSKDTESTKGESNERNKSRGKIASYLKIFENVDSAVRLKEPQTGSLKITKNEKNNDRNSCEHAQSHFFTLTRFMRRKSSGGGKKSPEIAEHSNFISLIPHGVKSSSFKLKNDLLESAGEDESNYNTNSNLKIEQSYNNLDATNTPCPNENNQKVPVLPDILGFSLISDPHEKNDTLARECAKDSTNVEIFDLKESYSSEADTIYNTEESVSSETTPTVEKIEAVITENIVSPEDNRKIPSICVNEIPDREIFEVSEEIDHEIPIKEVQSCSEDDIESDSISNEQHCEGKIDYSIPLNEEKCEDLLQLTTEEQSLESDLHRVSSPVESPARIVRGPQSVTVLRGESVTLAICFTGAPVPRVLWMKGGRVLRCSEDGRLSILEGREMSVVTVNEVTADDSGKYVVCVENEGGGDSRFASVAVVGFPEPPGGEPTASEFTDHSLVLSWYGSMYDGGSVVTGYQVEMCTLPDKKWHKVASSVNTSCTVQGLSMGQRYLFRVRAENRYGVSHPSKESKVICLNDYLQYDTSSDEEPEDVPENAVTIENGTHFSERFDLKEEVGKGKFGTVYRCVELSCGRPRAAKVIRCLKLKDKEKVRQEIEIMSRLHHPKLMQVLAAFESGRNMIMVMEFISGGELFERVIADDFVLTEHDCILFMKQICDGVAYMHKNDVLHLDLKPENILCKTRTSHKIKIIDFGLARVYSENDNLRILFGTPEFVAPEVLNYEPVSPASDMWSVGVVCYVLLSGLSPFMGDNDTETFANITRAEMDFDDDAFDEISEDAKDFISGLLIKKIKGRMSAEECLKHPWLATARLVQKRPLSTEKLKRFIIRRKWQKSGTAIRALGRMVSLSRSSLGSSCDSYSPLGSPTSSRSRSSLVSRSETADSGDSEVFSR